MPSSDAAPTVEHRTLAMFRLWSSIRGFSVHLGFSRATYVREGDGEIEQKYIIYNVVKSCKKWIQTKHFKFYERQVESVSHQCCG